MARPTKNSQNDLRVLTKLSVRGFKSLYDESSIIIKPLTILAGANSSGKSSIMQPLLLLKQTLEAIYDPGALLLDGPNARFSSFGQLLSRISNKPPVDHFSIHIEAKNTFIKGEFCNMELVFKKLKRDLGISEMNYLIENEKISLKPDMASEVLSTLVPKFLTSLYEMVNKDTDRDHSWQWHVGRTRCFLQFQLRSKELGIFTPVFPLSSPGTLFEPIIRSIIHVPGLRGNPERSYKTTAVYNYFPGTFENYAASVINHWYSTHNTKIQDLGNALHTLGLGWKVRPKRVDETHVELNVARLPHDTSLKNTDMINIVDAGFGVSQILPIIVALLEATPGQIVYLEQPEIHLHPRAQYNLAKLIADAAIRAVRVIVETHSSLLLLGLQSLVAEGYLPNDLLSLHWFSRGDDGATKVDSADVDKSGAFGNWPEDFGTVSLEAESRYLDSVQK